LPPSQQRAVEDAINALRQGASGELPALELVGPDAESAQLVARHAATALGLPLYRLPLEHLGSQPAELETFTRLWQRESLLSPVALYVDALEQDAPGSGAQPGSHWPGLRHFLERSHGIVVVGTREIRAKSARSTVTIDVGKPTPREQRDLWEALLHAPNPEIPARLSSQFNLGTSEIQRIARTATEVGSGPSELLERAWDASRATTRARLEALAARIEARATWAQLVLPDAELSLLHRVTDQVRARATVYQDWGFARTMNRGLGINALFAGESGTGKTMAAEVIANELRLDLYRIDLSSVVSKYIGETEKNLKRIFDAAEDGGMILFFDEADALFGKRSEVKDSHDRYANIEINYLLQRIESYRGLAILATNMKTSLDPAFSRRLRFIVQFPFPGLGERRRLWEQVFPADTPKDALELDRLARFDLTGASIHNAALCAAFLAAHEGSRVTMNHVLEGIRTEYRKLERPVNDADFQWAGKLGNRTGAAA
jgi:ATPase family associated with various cellular activities (AAA)